MAHSFCCHWRTFLSPLQQDNLPAWQREKWGGGQGAQSKGPTLLTIQRLWLITEPSPHQTRAGCGRHSPHRKPPTDPTASHKGPGLGPRDSAELTLPQLERKAQIKKRGAPSLESPVNKLAYQRKRASVSWPPLSLWLFMLSWFLTSKKWL